MRTAVRRLWRLALVLILLGGVFRPCSAAPEAFAPSDEPGPCRILVITSQPYLTTWFSAVNEAFVKEIKAQLSVAPKISYEYFDDERASDPAFNRLFGDLLRQKYGRMELDLVISVMPASANFLLEQGERDFPGVPKLFVLPTPQQSQKIMLQAGVGTVEGTGTAIAGTLDNIKMLLPRTKHLYVVAGIGKDDQVYVAQTTKYLEGDERFATVTYLNGLTAEELAQAIETAPADSAMLLLTYLQDNRGRQTNTLQLLEEFAPESKLPIFGMYDTIFGSGIVGGRLTSTEAYGRDAALAAKRLLDGERQLKLVTAPRFMYDWRQLQRWQIAENRLPEESIVRYRQASLWETDQEKVLLAIGVMLLQGGFIILLLINVAQRQRSQRATKESESLLRQIIDLVPHMIAVKDRDGKFILVNRAVAETYNTTVSELTGKTLAEVHRVESELKSFLASDREVIDTGEEKVIEQDLLTDANGTLRVMQKLKVPCAVFAEQQRAVLSVSIDITEQQRLQEELLQHRNHLEQLVQRRTAELEDANAELRRSKQRVEQMEERSRLILDSVNEGIFGVDALGRIVFINRQGAELLGYEQQMMIGRLSQDLFHHTRADGKPYQQEECQMVRANREQKPYIVNDEVFWRSDGVAIPVEYVAAPSYTPGNAIATVVVFRDIAERLAMEKNLRLAKELAESASKAKADFMANMSHEIRTPLNAIIGLTGLLLKTPLSPHQRDYAKKVRQSGQHLLSIINDILDFSKIEAGQLTLEKIEFHLESIFDNLAALIVGKATEKGLEVIFDIDRRIPKKMLGDPLRLGQILINYANNAVKFTEKGEIKIVVRLEKEDREQVFLRFVVQDTGVGLTEEEKTKLFQSFQQADASTTRKYGGTGLGLSIARQLAELMGGQVGVESEPGRGSKFWFTACLGKCAELSNGRVRVTAALLRNRKVLVVDDNDSARRVIAESLRDLGMQVDEANGGKDALGKISAAGIDQPYEIIFLDWQMPDLDGLETGQQILQTPLPLKPYLVMITAFGREEVFQAAQACGFDSVLLKPIQTSLLFETVARLFGEARVEHEAALQTVEVRNADFSGERILLVEDNELNQEVATALLEEMGVTVEIAENGQAAIEKVLANDYDLVLMDWQMPVLDGLSASREIRKEERLQALPIIAMTASVLQGDRERCLAAGMNDYLKKPIEPEELWLALRKWLKRRPEALPQPVDTQTEQAGLPEIPGIDLQLGMKRSLGKTELYLRMLRKFLQGQKEAPQQIRTALRQGDWRQAELLMHTLKGLLGNIGATGFQETAEFLESAFRECRPGDELETRLEEFEKYFAALIENLTRVLDEHDRLQAPQATDTADPVEVVRQLLTLLAADDPEAGEVFAAHRSLLQRILADAYGRIEYAVQSFEFEDALGELRMIAREQGLDE